MNKINTIEVEILCNKIEDTSPHITNTNKEFNDYDMVIFEYSNNIWDHFSKSLSVFKNSTILTRGDLIQSFTCSPDEVIEFQIQGNTIKKTTQDARIHFLRILGINFNC